MHRRVLLKDETVMSLAAVVIDFIAILVTGFADVDPPEITRASLNNLEIT